MDISGYSDLDDDIIDVSPTTPPRRGRLKWIVLAAFLMLIVLWQGIYLYVDALWYASLGFDSRFWYVLELGWGLFAIFALLTFGILKGGFYLLEKWFGTDKILPKRIVINNQPADINVSGYLRVTGWIVSILFAVTFGLSLSSDWNTWVLYFHQPPTAMPDPIFGRPVGFYLFTLPVYQLVTGWLMTLSIILVLASVIHAVLSRVPE